MQRRHPAAGVLELALIGVAGRRRSAAGSSSTASPTRRVARPRALPGPRARRARRSCRSLLGGERRRSWSPRSRSPSAAASRGSAATRASRSSSPRCSALGALLALSRASPPGIQSLLFGDILGPSDADLALAAVARSPFVAVLRLLHGRLLATGFDRASARCPRHAARGRRDCGPLLAALMVVVAVQGLGNLLVVAVLVGPAMAARRLAARIGPMMLISAAIAALAGSSESTLPTTPAPPPAPRSRWRSSPLYLLAALARAVGAKPQPADRGSTIGPMTRGRRQGVGRACARRAARCGIPEGRRPTGGDRGACGP